VYEFALRRQFITIFVAISVFLIPGALKALSIVDACSQKLITVNFPPQFVVETLRKFNVPEDREKKIIEDLKAKEEDVFRIVDIKASQLDPNPLRSLSSGQGQVLAKIFQTALFTVFKDVLKANEIENEGEIKEMFTDLQQAKAKNMGRCIEKQKALIQESVNSSSSHHLNEEIQHSLVN
jgi:hypothetical protein